VIGAKYVDVDLPLEHTKEPYFVASSVQEEWSLIDSPEPRPCEGGQIGSRSLRFIFTAHEFGFDIHVGRAYKSCFSLRRDAAGRLSWSDRLCDLH